jgi:D-beta-D-heptose 7-phosphate kinase/D-beta-D-heptose 1-phosphate adenosyltransferase
MLDVFEKYTSTKLSPEAPVPVIKLKNYQTSLGGAANVANNLAINNMDVTLIGQIGNDVEGQEIIKLCNEADISTKFLITSECQTIIKKRILVDDQHLARVDREDNFKAKDVLSQLMKHDVNEKTIILISDYDKGFLNKKEIAKIISYAKKKSALITIDTKKSDLTCFRNSDIITPNMSEFKKIIEPNKVLNLPEQGRQILKKYNIKSLLVTLSSEGLLYIDREFHLQSPAEIQQVHDITGAGDVVFAFWNMTYLYEKSIKKRLKICNEAASISLTKLGTNPVKLL